MRTNQGLRRDKETMKIVARRMTALVALSATAFLAACDNPVGPAASDPALSFGRSTPDPTPDEVCPAGVTCATFNDGTVGSAADFSMSSSAIAVAPSGEQFLGRFSSEELYLHPTLEPGTVEMRFDLYIIGAWGGEIKNAPPHVWELSYNCGTGTSTQVMFASFSNWRGGHQSFPLNLTDNGHYGGLFLNTGLDLLEYAGSGQTDYFDGRKGGDAADARYTIVRTFTNTCAAGTLNILMKGHNLGAMSARSWGIDNLSIE